MREHITNQIDLSRANVGNALPARNVAIVCAHWPVHRTVIYLARAIAQDGVRVKLFVHEAPLGDSADLLKGLPISVSNLSGSPFVGYGQVGRLAQRIGMKLAPTATLFGKACQDLRSRFRDSRQDIVLAVEKGGLALANASLHDIEAPIIYYSLELYDENHPLVRNDNKMAALHRLEQRNAEIVSAFLVQDQFRWRALCADLGVAAKRQAVFFPVSEPILPHPPVSNFLHERLSIPDRKKILLYYGVVRVERDCLELARLADHLPDDWVLVFHGPCNEETRRQIIACSTRANVLLSSEFIPSADREMLVASADIGLAIYRQNTVNDRLTGFASEKIALYLKCGVPVIGRENESYAHIWQAGAGRSVTDLDEIPQAVLNIAKGMDRFGAAARRLFESHYSFERNYRRAIANLLPRIGFPAC